MKYCIRIRQIEMLILFLTLDAFTLVLVLKWDKKCGRSQPSRLRLKCTDSREICYVTTFDFAMSFCIHKTIRKVCP